MENPSKSLALVLIVVIVVSQRQIVALREGTPGMICELHYENGPDISTLGYENARQTVPPFTGAIVPTQPMEAAKS
jgi:hypothetical protein